MILEFLYRRQHYKTIKITIGSKRLNAIVADTLTKKIIGLMFRGGLPKDTCMLFLFDSEAKQGIWMRNMKFPIDILWLDERKRISGMKKGAHPGKGFFDFETYYPERPSKYIIEFQSGYLSKNKVAPSTKVDFK
ncbi:MAG: DUF192 domain-containing protein [Candidatus Micrarchaeota archaeon]|nr:DUF192 domain-containing protein [Candidatus Micrarchaeota archaeon]